MSTTTSPFKQLFRGGFLGPAMVILFALTAVGLLLGYYVWPHYSRDYGKSIAFNKAMFSEAIEQPIAFSHRLHVTDKQIECQYCHSTTERSMNAGMPSVRKCLGCHDHIIPEHQEIQKLRSFAAMDKDLPWERVYYNPDHVFFPHYRHVGKGVKCQECHGEVETVDRLRKSTFYMGFCLECHERKDAPRTCTTCHQ